MRPNGLLRCAVLLISLLASRAGATMLTFDVFTNSLQTTRVGNGTNIPQTYGDNVSNPNPGTSFLYGAAGGPTPNVTVEYRWWTAPGQNNGVDGAIWSTGAGDLQYVIYPNVNAALLEIRFVPAAGFKVTIDSFDIASFAGAAGTANMTLKAVHDAGLVTGSTVWSAGPDGTVLVHGGAGVHDSYSPNVTAYAGHTISLILPSSGNVGTDNIVFSQSLVPEPASLALVAAAGGCAAIGRPRRAN